MHSRRGRRGAAEAIRREMEPQKEGWIARGLKERVETELAAGG